jgi:hypothetical protein
MELNNKEFKRTKDHRNNYEVPTDPYLSSLRVIRPGINYPDIENNWPGFFTEVNLKFLAQKFKPYSIIDAEAKS